MRSFVVLCARNIKIFFKEKGLFFTAFITPIILLVLYILFLANVFESSLVSSLPDGFHLPKKVFGGFVGGQLVSSLLCVTPVTVAFCANLVSVQDKITGAANDFFVTPVKKTKLALSYYLATFVATLIICLIALVASLIYIAAEGWWLSAADVFLLLADVVLTALFGTALSSFVNCFVSTQGQSQAEGTIIGAGYGFLSGAYMPISSFGSGMQKVFSLLPSTYATPLFRKHAMEGAISQMAKLGVPDVGIEKIRNAVDVNFFFFGHKVSEGASYGVIILTIALLVGAYVLATVLLKRKTAKPDKRKKERT